MSLTEFCFVLQFKTVKLGQKCVSKKNNSNRAQKGQVIKFVNLPSNWSKIENSTGHFYELISN